MSRYLLKIAYLGTNFCGWQVQNNGNTVQSEICNALTIMFKTKVNVTGCSRTDSGVHAKEFYCHFDLDTVIDTERIIEGINHNTSSDISVLECKKVPDDFHVRYSAVGKNYVYRICNAKTPNPFENNRAYWYKYPLNIDMMQEAANQFLGTHDFSAFCSSGSSVEDKVRTITDCKIIKTDDIVEISVTGNGFLYNMVRIIAGTLIEVGGGKRDAKSISAIIQSKNRKNSGVTAPACGLYLNKVIY